MLAAIKSTRLPPHPQTEVYHIRFLFAGLRSRELSANTDTGLKYAGQPSLRGEACVCTSFVVF